MFAHKGHFVEDDDDLSLAYRWWLKRMTLHITSFPQVLSYFVYSCVCWRYRHEVKQIGRSLANECVDHDGTCGAGQPSFEH
jgi:hypothetical protein